MKVYKPTMGYSNSGVLGYAQPLSQNNCGAPCYGQPPLQTTLGHWSAYVQPGSSAVIPNK